MTFDYRQASPCAKPSPRRSHALAAVLLGIAALQADAAAGRTRAAATADRPVIIDAQGDSTMFGYQTSDGFNKSWQTPDNPPALLQAALQARFGPRVIVQNNGVPGARSSIARKASTVIASRTRNGPRRRRHIS